MNAQQYYLNVIQPLINRKAYRPDEWEARGNVFDPECQIIVGSDKDSQEAARVTLESFGDLVMAAHVEIGPFVSIELVFSPLAANPVGFYNRLPQKMPPKHYPRCADELVPLDFSGYIHVPAGAKSWTAVKAVARTAPFELDALQSFVGGNIEVYGTTFRKRCADIYVNEIGALIHLPINPLATAFAADHRPDLYRQLLGDVVLTFGHCCEKRTSMVTSGF